MKNKLLIFFLRKPKFREIAILLTITITPPSVKAGPLPRNPLSPPTTHYTSSSHIVGVATGDINGDGRADIVCSSYAEGTITAFLQREDGTLPRDADFVVRVTPPPLRNGARGIAIGDIDSSGLNAVVVSVVGNEGEVIAILYQDGKGGLSPPQYRSLGSRWPRGEGNGVAIGDVTGDGRKDVIVVGNFSSPYSVFLAVFPQEKDGRLSELPTVYDLGSTVANHHGAIALGDVNSDGRIDVCLPNSGTDRQTLLVMLQTEDGRLAIPPQAYDAPGAYALAIGDITSSRRNSIVVTGDQREFPTLLIFHQNDMGHLNPPITYRIPRPIGFREGIHDVLIGDVDGDQHNEVVAAAELWDRTGWIGRLWVIHQDGRGGLDPSFSSYDDTASGGFLNAASDDLNADGYLDVVASQSAAQVEPPRASIHVFLQQPK